MLRKRYCPIRRGLCRTDCEFYHGDPQSRAGTCHLGGLARLANDSDLFANLKILIDFAAPIVQESSELPELIENWLRRKTRS